MKVFRRNRKLFIALAVTTGVAVLIKVAQGVSLDEDEPADTTEPVADETLEV
jgi:hypothetical protein